MPSRPEHLLAARMAEIQPFRVMALLARARQLEAEGRDIVHMEIGEPDFPTPQPILEAGAAAIATGDVHYTTAVGLPALRQAIAADYARRYGVGIDARRIVITPGASGALLLVLGVLLDPGRAVLMADPGYPCNRNFVRFLEGTTRAVPVDATSGYQLNRQNVAQYWSEDTCAVMVASPSNPTGTVIDTAELDAIVDYATARGGHVIVDEIYQGLIYDGESSTVLKHHPDAFVINSFSKFYGMTGWRIGWLVAPEWAIEAIDKLAQNLFLAAPTPAQHAALAAFRPETQTILEQRREAFRQRRDYLYPALKDLGFDIPVKPQGAFYLYASCEKFSNNSFEFAQRVLEDIGVAITPGLDFGNNQPEKHLRFAYTTSMQRLEEGIKRLTDYLK